MVVTDSNYIKSIENYAHLNTRCKIIDSHNQFRRYFNCCYKAKHRLGTAEIVLFD